jgi:hypothetical protein
MPHHKFHFMSEVGPKLILKDQLSKIYDSFLPLLFMEGGEG